VAGVSFANYGAHCDAYPVAYFTAACALGATESEADIFFKKLDKTLKEWKKMKPLPPAKGVSEAPSGEPDAPPAEAVAAAMAATVEAAVPLTPGLPTQTEQAMAPVPLEPHVNDGAASALAAPLAPNEAAAPLEPLSAASAPPAPTANEPNVGSELAVVDGFTVVSEATVYKRFLQVEDRVVAYPDGRQASFDIVGHPKNNYVFTVVFTYHSRSNSVTLLREFAQAAPPYAAHVLTLPCGGFEPRKHADMLAAAKAELSEEAHLTGGEWHRLLPEGHPGVLESKWCRNRFTPFLCIDPTDDAVPGARDAEEKIEILREWPLERLRRAMAEGELLLPSLQTCVSALSWLRDAGRLETSGSEPNTARP
jgi:hypothetical protein